ncbi:hypothetical protein H0Z60_09395 [Ectothiorhodospiraceae bacterium WFHF3C12]|nr:hypothetical protein [Ectothiorhodospiraceae bacterium WFHF3C12]
MLRDDRQVAMNEVRGQLLALAEYYGYARHDLDQELATFFRQRGEECAAQARQIGEAIGALGDLPDGSKPDSYLFHELAETLMASLKGDRAQAHLDERLAEERSLIRYVDQALALPGTPAVAVEQLRAVRAGAEAASHRLGRHAGG